MTGNTQNFDRWNGRRWRIAAWAGAALILLLPMIPLQLSGREGWEVADFAVPGALLFATGLAFELLAGMTGAAAYRAAVGVAVAAALLLVWVTLAVGIIGNEGNAANLMYFGVLAAGIVGALLARFRPRGMARALFATALAQVLVGVIALVAGFGSEGSLWWLDILGLTGYFAALFAGSALLFRKAAQGPSPAAARPAD